MCWYFLNFLHPMRLLSSRIVSEAWVVVCISELVLVQRMHTTSPVLGTGVALRIHRVAHCAPFSGPLFIICFLTIPTHHLSCNYQFRQMPTELGHVRWQCRITSCPRARRPNTHIPRVGMVRSTHVLWKLCGKGGGVLRLHSTAVLTSQFLSDLDVEYFRHSLLTQRK